INAVQAIEKQGNITVRTGEQGDNIWFEVQDDGHGIDEETLGKIFDPFFTTKDVGKGTGLGLHLSHNIVSAHGGAINVCSQAGKGTTFRVTLPKAGPPEENEEQQKAA
ncbi:MAG: ATP-binding protein, partial [Planctomycetota bacterium]